MTSPFRPVAVPSVPAVAPLLQGGASAVRTSTEGNGAPGGHASTPRARAGAGDADDAAGHDGVRWTQATSDEERRVARPGPYGAGAPRGGDPWTPRLATLTAWGRADWPLSSEGLSAAGTLALALGMRFGTPGGGNGRGALGELVRLALAAAQGDVAALRAAIADHQAPAARALLARVLGADQLLATLRVRDGQIVAAELRATPSREAAAATLTALFGDVTAAHGPLPALRALSSGWVRRGGRVDAPLLGTGVHDAGIAAASEEELVLVLPLLALTGEVPNEPPAAVLASLFGGMLGAPSPFLRSDDVRTLGAPAPALEEDAEEEEAEDDADDATDEDAEDDTPAAREEPEERPTAEREEPPLDEEVQRAALARARARAHQVVEVVTATVATDDGVAEHVADVVPWLEEATARELRALILEDWTGDEGIEVARALAADDPEIAEVVRHARRTDTELVVEIDAKAALAWLRHHRPDVVEALEDVLEEE